MYIDLHNHLLPGVDDGAAKIEQTLAGIRIAIKEKVSRLCFTPHIWDGRFPNTPEKLKEVFDTVREAAKDLPIELHLGSEVFFSHAIVENFRKGSYITIGTRKRYLLLEFSTSVLPSGASDGLYKLMLEGVEPVIAHPERYLYVQKNPKCLFEFAQSQIPMQVTTQSITGSLGTLAQKTAFKLLDMGLISFIASDAHHPEKRPLQFREAVRVINRRYGHTTARLLAIENPKRILEGRHLLPVAGIKGKKSGFQ